MKPVNQTFEGAGKERLVTRAKRLVRLLELEAPKVVIAGAVGLLVQAIEIYAPEEYYKSLGDTARSRWKSYLGYCETEDCPNLVLRPDVEDLCYDCDQVLKKDAEAIDEDQGTDIENPKFECEGCGRSASIEIVCKDKRYWSCPFCRQALMDKFGVKARSAPFSKEEK